MPNSQLNDSLMKLKGGTVEIIAAYNLAVHASFEAGCAALSLSKNELFLSCTIDPLFSSERYAGAVRRIGLCSEADFFATND